MITTYRFTVTKPTPCPFSGLHHADGDLLVLDGNQLAFHAPAEDGTPGRQLTDPRPLKSDADVDYVNQWLADAVKAGTLVDLTAPAKSDEPAKTEPPKAPEKPADPKAPAAK